MALEITMPQLGLTMEEGTIGKWLKQEGDEVKVGDVLVQITTDKLTSEIESETEGVLLKIVAKEGEDVLVQGLLGIIGTADETVNIEGDAPVKEEEAVFVSEKIKVEELKMLASVPIQVEGRIKISPLAKKTAVKLGVNYAGIEGSGTGGRIVQKDILSKAEEQKNIPSTKTEVPEAEVSTPKTVASKMDNLELMEGDTVVKLAGMRKVVAERMFKSYNEIPSVTQTVKIDVTELMNFRKQLNGARENKLSVNDFLLKAVAKALKNNKYILVSLDGDQIIQRAHVNLGMAVALDDGLIVPVIKDADKMGIEELSQTAKDLAVRAREGKLSMEEYKGSTFTISNLGMLGVETFTPIINQPDAAILGICAVDNELGMDDEGNLFKRQVMRISMTYDHRLIDGATAAKFQIAIKDLLENPINIIL